MPFRSVGDGRREVEQRSNRIIRSGARNLEPVTGQNEHEEDRDRFIERRTLGEKRRGHTENVARADGEHDEYSHFENALHSADQAAPRKGEDGQTTAPLAPTKSQ